MDSWSWPSWASPTECPRRRPWVVALGGKSRFLGPSLEHLPRPAMLAIVVEPLFLSHKEGCVAADPHRVPVLVLAGWHVFPDASGKILAHFHDRQLGLIEAPCRS